MEIRLFTDYACPFCMIQKEMIKEAIAELGEKAGDIKIEPVFMEIHPETPEGGARASELLPKDYLESTNGKLAHYGEPYGMKPTVNGFMSNSRKAQIVRGFLKSRQKKIDNFRAFGMDLGNLAIYDGKVWEYDEITFREYNMNGKDIGSYEVLDEILNGIGIDYPAREMCMDKDAKDMYEQDKRECYDKGIRITPTLEIDGQLYPGLNKPGKIIEIIERSFYARI